MTEKNKTALVFGATGLVGNFLLRHLSENPNYKTIYSFGRRKTGVNYAKVEEIVLDFNKMNTSAHLIKGDDVFIALGTTIKKAGSQQAFRKVDFEYVHQAAQIAAQNKVKQLCLVTAAGADANSSIFYNRVKGEIEDAVKKLPFVALHIFQPSILLGDRGEKRFAEDIGQSIGRFLDKLIGKSLGKYRPVSGEDVAKAMIKTAQENKEGSTTYLSHEIVEAASEYSSVLN